NDTRQMLDELNDGITAYLMQYGQVPQAEDFRDLVNRLNPRFVPRVIRTDAWWNPFSYSVFNKESFELRSAGVDGIFGTEDDLVIRRPAQP
ncbi:MAG TPA: type II secretion system protein GspG, partial [Acidobacteriota bacterium]|nr:type II secretion system protein GspG [Acidobacteriota bacterium]